MDNGYIYMNINERIVELIDKLFSGNKRAFSLAIGVSPAVIENIVGKRKSSPSFEVTNKIVSSIDNLDPGWLLTGEGEMLKSGEEKKERENNKEPRFSKVNKNIDILLQSISKMAEIAELNSKTIDRLVENAHLHNSSINKMVETAEQNSQTLRMVINYLISEDKGNKLTGKGQENLKEDTLS
ncbi:MAG: hypothetical protein LUG18_12215 [Candidatus Azobacteroides sp.]|nr:hypothetical protein [Candidatus Azobacteroides sp.]